MIYDSLFLSYVLLLIGRLRSVAESRLKCSATQIINSKGVYCASLNTSVPLGRSDSASV